MRKILYFLFTSFFVCGLLVNDVEAKRFGGSKSFGYQRSSNYSQSYAPKKAAAAPGAQSSFASKLLPALGGVLLGGLLASLFFGNGIGSGIIMWLIIAAIVFFVWRFIQNRKLSQTTPPLQYARQGTNAHPDMGRVETAPPSYSINSTGSGSTINPTADLAANFDPAAFLRECKVLFIRLQEAYDKQNLTDIRAFTTPAVFAEVQLQLSERSDEVNQTEILNLDAELLDAGLEEGVERGSVRFTGMIREHPNAAESLNEIWHFQKENGQWIVAGIQQNVT